MGRTALISHARGKKHTSRVVLSAKVKKEQHTLAAFWHPETEQSDGQEASTSYLVREKSGNFKVDLLCEPRIAFGLSTSR